MCGTCISLPTSTFLQTDVCVMAEFECSMQYKDGRVYYSIGTVVCVRNLHMFCVHISIPLGMYQRVVFTVSESKIMDSLSHKRPKSWATGNPRLVFYASGRP